MRGAVDIEDGALKALDELVFRPGSALKVHPADSALRLRE